MENGLNEVQCRRKICETQAATMVYGKLKVMGSPMWFTDCDGGMEAAPLKVDGEGKIVMKVGLE